MDSVSKEPSPHHTRPPRTQGTRRHIHDPDMGTHFTTSGLFHKRTPRQGPQGQAEPERLSQDNGI